MDFDAHQQCEFRDDDHNDPRTPEERQAMRCIMCDRKIFLDEAIKKCFCSTCGNVLSMLFHKDWVREIIEKYYSLPKDTQAKVFKIFGYKLDNTPNKLEDIF